MLGLPQSTEFNKRIPKQKFYEQIDVTPALKRFFVDQIRLIYWRNKLAPTTMNVAPGEQVTEIEVFEVRLNTPTLDESVLRQIDREIPYHILFVLEYEGKYQVWIGYKETAESGKKAFKVSRHYHTDWLVENELPVKIEGLNLDTIYANFVRQIAGDSFQSSPAESLKESVEKDERRQLLTKQLDTLQVKLRKEKQFNKQVQINSEIKNIREELEKIYVS